MPEQSPKTIENISIMHVNDAVLEFNWGLIQDCIQSSVDTVIDDVQWQQIFAEFKRGRLIAYYIVGMEGRNHVALGMVVFQPGFDRFTGDRVMTIYAIYGYREMRPEWYSMALEKLREVALALKVKKLIGITNVPAIVNIVTELGGSAKRRYIELEVK